VSSSSASLLFVSRSTYHHGDLPVVILAGAARLVAQRGVDQVSLRELAREAGVSHAAPAYHFTDRQGVFTALATQGFELLTETMRSSRSHFLDAAVAYVTFAIDHPGHYQVMFNKSLLDTYNADLLAAEAATAEELSRGVASLADPKAHADPTGARLAAWSLMHGFVMLWLNEAVTTDPKITDPVATTQRIATILFDN